MKQPAKDVPASAPVEPPRRRSRLPGWGARIILGLLAVAIVAVRSGDFLADHAYANVATWVLGFSGVMTLAVWFFFRSGYSRPARLRTLAALVCVLGLLGVFFRVDHISGELVPVWSFRFAVKHDRLISSLASRPAGPSAAAVDVRTTTAHDFPQFLGPQRRAAVEDVRLARDWTVHPPRKLWRHEIGAGWSGFAVVNGHALTMEQRGDQEMVTCYNVLTGRLEWAYGSPSRYEALAGGVGPRATPTIDHGRVYAMGATGHLVCLEGSTGRLVWERNLLDDLGTTSEADARIVLHGRSGSPLIVGNFVVVPGGGQASHVVSLLAYDAQSGRPVWEGGQRQISYSSPARATLAGIDQLLIVNEDTVAGHAPDSGRLLWEYNWPGRTAGNANVSQAFPIEPNRVLLSKAYGQGAMLLELHSHDAGTLRPSVVWRNTKVLRTKFTNVTLHDDYLYGLSDGVLECVAVETGQRRWKEGRYQHGQLLRADDLLLILSEAGEVVLVEASPERNNHVLGRFQALEGMTWNTLALAGPHLLVRNAEEAACYELPLAGEAGR